MPELEIKHQLNYRLSLTQLGDLKRYWKCAMVPRLTGLRDYTRKFYGQPGTEPYSGKGKIVEPIQPARKIFRLQTT